MALSKKRETNKKAKKVKTEVQKEWKPKTFFACDYCRVCRVISFSLHVTSWQNVSSHFVVVLVQFVVIVAVVAVHVVVAVTARFTNQRFATLVEARSQSIQHDLSGSIIAIAVAVSVSVASSFSMEKHFHGKHCECQQSKRISAPSSSSSLSSLSSLSLGLLGS